MTIYYWDGIYNYDIVCNKFCNVKFTDHWCSWFNVTGIWLYLHASKSNKHLV